MASLYRPAKRGQLPVAPAILALALILEAYTGVSDDEVIEATVMDRRWQLVLDCGDAERQEAKSVALHQERVERYHQIQDLYAKKVDPANITRQVGISRKSVQVYLKMKEPPARTRIHRQYKPLIDPYKEYLIKRWNDGCRNAQLVYQGTVRSIPNISHLFSMNRATPGAQPAHRQTPCQTSPGETRHHE